MVGIVTIYTYNVDSAEVTVLVVRSKPLGFAILLNAVFRPCTTWFQRTTPAPANANHQYELRVKGGWLCATAFRFRVQSLPSWISLQSRSTIKFAWAQMTHIVSSQFSSWWTEWITSWRTYAHFKDRPCLTNTLTAARPLESGNLHDDAVEKAAFTEKHTVKATAGGLPPQWF